MSGAALAVFDEANRLWFGEGASARALALYEQAAQAAPDDPVVAFQLARACWGLGHQNRAAAALAVAMEQADALSSLGRSILIRTRPRLAAPPPELPGLPSESLDVDVLEPLDLAPERWLDVAGAAELREMYGLAAHAVARGSTFVSLELEEDEHRLRNEASAAIDMLSAMFRSPRAPGPARPGSPPPPPVAAAGPPPGRPARTATADPRSLRAPVVEIDVVPRTSTVDDPLVLAVRLVNPTNAPLAVNGRLLLNRPNSPQGYGEIGLSVDGPPGYANGMRFTIRTGAAGADDLVTLRPGGELERSYELTDYETLDAPGAYRIWVTYRNDVDGVVDGLRPFVGATSSQPVAIERRPRPG
jgi:Tetratricopeptide repeat